MSYKRSLSNRLPLQNLFELTQYSGFNKRATILGHKIRQLMGRLHTRHTSTFPTNTGGMIDSQNNKPATLSVIVFSI
jgi:hypothetical protein